MATKEQIKMGVTRYFDNEILPKLPVTGIKRIAVVTAASLFINTRIDKSLDDISKNSFSSYLGIVCGDGVFRLDQLAEELKKNMPDEGIKLSPSFFGFSFGEMIFNRADIDTLYRYINS